MPLAYKSKDIFQSVISGECTYCLHCIDVCPENAVSLRPSRIELIERRTAVKSDEKDNACAISSGL